MLKTALTGLAVTCALLLSQSLALRAATADDIVLYASDVSLLSGHWTVAEDTSAAGGQLLTTPDAGWANTVTPLAAPSHVVDVTFNAAANTNYRVWLRLRAGANSKYNDSVFVQFSDAVDAAGAPLYRVGSTTGLLVNLQSCDGCALSGWGWFNSAYWLQQSSTVRFATAGPRTLRVQTREDGVQLDQIVLSPLTFLTTAPGPIQNDQTIVAKPVPPGPTPFPSTVVLLPTAFQASDFDNGGEGVAYHDSTPGNSGARYRTTGVDLEDCSLGGVNVGYIVNGEWLTYSVNVATAGSYRFAVQVASPLATGRFHPRFGATSLPQVAVPATGGWQVWTTVFFTANLPAGPQVMTLEFDSGSFNLAKMTATFVPPPFTTFFAATTVDLKSALNAAKAGDTILLQAGATFVGNFVLPVKTGTAFITIRSSASDASLPAAGTRIDPSYAPALPKLRSTNTAAVVATAPGAHHYRLQFLEFLPNVQGAGNMLDLGDGSDAQTSLAMVPSELIVDRVYMHGDPVYGQKRAIALNSASTTIRDSYISGIKMTGQDSQAIANWNGPGPYTITNNYLEAASENIIFGGSDPAISGLIASDITITGNHFSKQLAWRDQGNWNVKNLLELKNAQRVVIDGNLLEYNWLAGQAGYAVVFTPRNQYGGAPWTVVRDVQFTNNHVRHVSSGINILGHDNLQLCEETTNILIRNNVFEDVSAARWGGYGRFLLVNGGSYITVDHNTILQDGKSAFYGDTNATTGFVLTNNIVADYSWVIMGGGTSPGNGTIARYFPNSVILNGIFAGANATRYPGANFYPPTLSDVGFVDLAGGDYRLGPSSPYRNAGSDGLDLGANIDAVPMP